ncbi:hypothetical protein TRFO_19721 [Tritrichomonas foetus]|uniref:Uncharacterized protein n=1 Tax=Tritrichomonas foetus TaxID=1144522 RepID=A0A1J4KND9_9EUKA|nr:hypothetical protein TRFO_19721 [Tritrichomonas foetus]|eukprot:OHT10909.1 hypothetical protein TRFO_19721 [Tritrichomonas foetus]
MLSHVDFKLISLSLGGNLVKPNDKIRINVTVYPSHEKYPFTCLAKDIGNLNHFWALDDCKQKMTKLLITIRRKSFMDGDPILGKFEVNFSDQENVTHNMFTSLQDRTQTQNPQLCPYFGEAHYEVCYTGCVHTSRNSKRIENIPSNIPNQKASKLGSHGLYGVQFVGLI